MQRLALLALLILPAALFAQADDAKVGVLIRDLASEKWDVRERAQRELAGIGEPARKQLVTALDDKDPEVRVRASATLISIGESFAYAVECATSDSDGRKAHGRAALSNLFRIDDPNNLRALGPQELQNRYNGPYNNRGQETNQPQPPALAIARLEALSGMRILVSQGAAEAWGKLMAERSIDVQLQGDPKQPFWLRMCLQNLTRMRPAASPSSQLALSPVRIGRQVFFYVVAADNLGADDARRAGEELITALLGDGPASARAAALLAEGAATEVATIDRIRAEYLKKPESLRLMWLVLALGADEAASKAVRGTDSAAAMALLGSNDWAALSLCGRYLDCLEPAKKSALLSPFVATARATLPLTCALWWARGADLDAPARTRAAALLSCTEDAVSGAAVRWFCGAATVSDAELEQIWTNAQNKKLDSAFCAAAMELIARPDIAPRLVERARTALAGATETPQMLAAAVLAGRASADDLGVALDKLKRPNVELIEKLAMLFEGCNELADAALDKMAEGLVTDDDNSRRAFLTALRACGKDVQTAVLKRLAEKIAADAGENATPARKYVVARIYLWAFQAAGGDAKALEQLMACATGEDADQAKSAGGALPYALEEAVLTKELEKLRERPNTPHGTVVIGEAYTELCRRAVAKGDRGAFRKFMALAMTSRQQMYMYNNPSQELAQLQARVNRAPDASAKAEPMPRAPLLSKLELE